MAITFDKVVGGNAVNDSTSTDVALTVAAGGVAAGNLVVVVCTFRGQTASSVADSRGNIYTKAVESASRAADTGLRVALFYSRIATTLQAGDTITATGSAVGPRAVRAVAFNSIGSSPLDITASSPGGGFGTAADAGTAGGATAQNDEVIVAGFATASINDSIATPGTGYTDGGANGTVSRAVMLEYKITTATETAHPLATLASGADWVGAFATFKGSSAPVNTVAPAATGLAAATKTLTTTTGTWTGDVSSGYTYQWKHADDAAFTTNVANATNASTASTYVVAAGEKLKYLRCTVTATGTGGSASANSNVVGPIGTSTGTLAGRMEFQSDLIIEQLVANDDPQFFPIFG